MNDDAQSDEILVTPYGDFNLRSFEQSYIKGYSLNIEYRSVDNENYAKALGQVMIALLNRCPQVDMFNITIYESCRYQHEIVRSLAEVITSNRTLRTLEVSIEKIDEEGMKALAEALKQNSSLQVLELNIQEISDEGAKALAQSFEVNSSLKKLTFNSLGFSLGNNCLGKILLESLKENTSIEVLDFGNSTINNDGAMVLAEALKKNASLEVLYLGENQIGDEGAQALAEALKKNLRLKSLCLRHNRIGDEGAKALAGALKANVSLERLDLDGNQLGDEAARALAETLKANASLKHLHLSGVGMYRYENQLGDEGAKALAEALKANASLEYLCLKGHQISDEGVNALTEMMRVNFKLTDVEGFMNPSVESYLKRNKKLQSYIGLLIALRKCAEDKYLSSERREDLKRYLKLWNKHFFIGKDKNTWPLITTEFPSLSKLFLGLSRVIENELIKVLEPENIEQFYQYFPGTRISDIRALFELWEKAEALMVRFSKKIQEIQVCGSSIGVQKRFDELIALYNKLCDTEGEFKALHNARPSWCSHNPDLRLTNNAQSADFIKALGMIKDALLDNVRQMPDKNLQERQDKLEMIKKTKGSAAIKHRRGNFVFFTTGFSPMSSYAKLEKMDSELSLQMKNHGDTNADKLR